jgi:hypothetical protein
LCATHRAPCATSRYHHKPSAVAAKFKRTDECVFDKKEGGMRYHYVNPKSIGSTDPARPEALLYEDSKNGRRELIAVEWIVPKGQPRPSLFGKCFDPPSPGLPDHYSLHAWIYKKNPKGVFYPWNPK